MPDGAVGHAELTSGDQVVMIGLTGGERFGSVSSITLVFVENVDATCERASAAGGWSSARPRTNRGAYARPSSPISKAKRWKITEIWAWTPAKRLVGLMLQLVHVG